MAVSENLEALKHRPCLLYLAYSFRPGQMIAAVRAWNTANQLTRLGWDVRVVTPDPNLLLHTENLEKVTNEVISAGFSRIFTDHDLKMLVHGQMKYPQNFVAWLIGGICRHVANIFGVESQIGWLPAAERACAHLKPGEIDCILATGSPYVSFRLARKLAKRLKCPFVLDYRDPWRGDPHVVKSNSRREINEEASLLQECAAVTIVSPSWAKLLDMHYGVGYKTYVISNGYDNDMFVNVLPKHYDHFSIVYAGTLYPPKRILDPVFQAINECLKRTTSKIIFHYYGPYIAMVREAACKYGIENNVEIHGNVSRDEALSAQKGANLNLIVTSVEDHSSLADRGIVTGKIFDCMALERPMLVVAPCGSDVYKIAETSGRIGCFSGEQVPLMINFVLACMENKEPPLNKPELYQWNSLGAQLNELLRTVRVK